MYTSYLLHIDIGIPVNVGNISSDIGVGIDSLTNYRKVPEALI